MKYQVYLNKETSEIVNKIAEQNGIKPNTQIKQFMEVLIAESLASYKRFESEFERRNSKNGKRK